MSLKWVFVAPEHAVVYAAFAGTAQHQREIVVLPVHQVVPVAGAEVKGPDVARTRVRGNDVILSEGFIRFTELLNQLIQRGQKDGSFRADLDAAALCSAMLGCAEGMIRDALIAERLHKPKPFDNDTVQRVFGAMVGGLAP